MKKQVRLFAPLLPPLALLAALLVYPSAAAEGARSGLSVCAGVVVPSLFPFLVLSALLSAQGLPAALARLLGPPLARLGLPPEAAAPFLLGLCGGYPVGADAVARLVREGTISPEEGARLLPVCNNTGPGFIIGTAGGAVFGSVRVGALLYLSHVLAACTLALRPGARAKARPIPRGALPAPVRADVFPSCIAAAASVTLNLCGYVVFFSVLGALLRGAGVFSALAGAVSVRFGAEMRWSAALLAGLLELGGGVAAMRGMPAHPANLALTAFLLGFGGLSVHAQTLAAVSGTNIRCARHFAGRILHGFLSAGYILLFSALRLPRI